MKKNGPVVFKKIVLVNKNFVGVTGIAKTQA
jgi:hypothetical protein